MQTIMSDYISLPQKLGLKMPLEGVSHCVFIFFFPGNCVYFISGSFISRVNDSKADRGMICSLSVRFKFLNCATCRRRSLLEQAVFLDTGVQRGLVCMCGVGLWLPGEEREREGGRREETRAGMKGLSQEIKINSS